MGKSHLLKSLLPTFDRLLVLDTLEEYELPYFTTIEGAASWFDQARPARFRIALRIPRDDIDRAFRWAWAVRPVTLLLEETDLYAPPNNVCEGIAYLVDYGRRYGLNACFVTRRPFQIDRRLTSNARYVYLFPTQEPRDREYWSDLLPQQVVAEVWRHLDSSTEPGDYACVDTLTRTCSLVRRDGRKDPTRESAA